MYIIMYVCTGNLNVSNCTVGTFSELLNIRWMKVSVIPVHEMTELKSPVMMHSNQVAVDRWRQLASGVLLWESGTYQHLPLPARPTWGSVVSGCRERVRGSGRPLPGQLQGSSCHVAPGGIVGWHTFAGGGCRRKVCRHELYTTSTENRVTLNIQSTE